MANARWTDDEYAKFRARRLGTTIKEVMAKVRPVAVDVIRKAENKARHDAHEALEHETLALLARQLGNLEIEPPEPAEHFFHPTRKWRFDRAYPLIKVAIELEGGTRANGRHNRHAGYEGDCEKYDEAAVLGWRVLRFTYAMVSSGYAAKTIASILTPPSP